MTALDDTIHELTRNPMRWVDRDNGSREAVQEYSLLTQLEQAKTMKLNVDSGGGGGASLPLGAGPMDIEQEIILTIHQTLLPSQRYDAARLPLPARVQYWARLVDEDVAIDWAVRWAESIKDLFRRKKVIQRPCPNCGVEKLSRWIDGEEDVKPALVIVIDTMSCTCKNCLSQWAGIQELTRLSGQLV